LRSQEFTIVRCDSCGLCYTNPRPDPAHIGRYYPQDYAPYQAGEGEFASKHAIERWIILQEYGAPQLRPTGPAGIAARLASVIRPAHRLGGGIRWHGRGRLLDFGCGGGKFLRQMKACGWDVTGIDFSDTAVRAVRDSGIAAHQGSLPHPQIAPNSFDVVTMRHSLEHVYDPLAVLRGAREALDAGGLLLIEVPNYRSWDVEYFSHASIWLDLPRHLLHFSPQTLSELVRRASFEVKTVRVRCRSSAFAKALKSAGRRDRGRWDGLLRLKLARQLAAAACEWRGSGNIIELLAQKV
jgi:2-polyprenyl-3-methyl-5-hydroxy-6-metoxy-1,4-benzoquinol methylase